MLLALYTPYKPAVALILVGTAVNGLTGSYGTYLTVRRRCARRTLLRVHLSVIYIPLPIEVHKT